jgi:hypothetical protein
MTATQNIIDQEKMAVIIQEVVGREYGDNYYPSFSGVGRSLNYYPINDEEPEDGVAQIAVGLGKYIVDGGQALRFSPRHPDNILQTSTLDLALSDTQRKFYALDMKDAAEDFSVDDGFNIKKLKIQDAVGTGSLRFMVSTYDYMDNMLRDCDEGEGRRVVTFANVLHHDAYPLADIIDFMLTTGQKAMGRPVEIEFAGTIGSDNPDDKESKGNLYWLQIRPMVDRREMLDEKVMEASDDKLILKSLTALGHGLMDNITSIVMMKEDKFSMSNNPLIAREIEKINRTFTEKGESYILIGAGRWGSSDPALGIPVKWPHISSAKLIVEMSMKGQRIDPSQGTHFFQNLTSFGVGYFTVGAPGDGSYIDNDFINAQSASYDSDFVRIIRFDKPLTVAINGKTGLGIVLKP